ncbi:MAG: DUF4398 domain-containing protein [Thermodesulfobacteriota bacterium]
MKYTGKIPHQRLWLLLLVGALVLAGCATGKQEIIRTKISNAEMMIKRAEQSEAKKYAPLQIKLAEERLQEARQLMKEDDYEEADQKAEEALMDARLAEAKAQAEKAKMQARDKEESVETLRDEIDRTLQVE